LKNNKEIMLIREDWTIRVDAKSWAEMLLFLNDNGWKPDNLLSSFLGEREVSDLEAKKINVAGQKILDNAIKNPFLVYPVLFDMGKFSEIVYFCEEGSFNISSG
jgi:hypothetical protein